MNSQKIVLITGVSREMGLGFEIAKKFKANNYQVIITARNFEKVNELAQLIGVIPLQLDITSNQSVHEAVKVIELQFGKLDVLVNNAATNFDFGGEALTSDLNVVKETLETNLIGTWRMSQAFVALLKKSENGRLINVGSAAGSFSDTELGLFTNPGNFPIYGISKTAINALTVKLALELKDTKIKVNSVCPGLIATYPGMSESGAKPVSQGADSIYWAATINEDGPTGGFFRNGIPLSW